MKDKFVKSVLVTFFVLLAATCGYAGEWHVAGKLQCGDCHLQHSSEKGQPLPEGETAYLLRKASTNEVCLSCHDGTDPTAPDVLLPTPMYAGTVSKEGAAGSLLGILTDNPHGHSLGVPATAPLQGTGTAMTLSCASCHAVHGNSNFCNLLQDPAGTGAHITVALDTQVFVEFHPDVPPTSSGSTAAYSRDNVAYGQGLSAWCTSCHDVLATNAPMTAPAHFNNHPSDVALNAFGLEPHTDPAHWVAGIGEGFEGASGIVRLAFQAPAATSFVTAREAAASNQVGCLSCHGAHGTTYKKDILWPYLEGGDSFLAGCQQCHNK